jgi:hypothetical protein
MEERRVVQWVCIWIEGLDADDILRNCKKPILYLHAHHTLSRVSTGYVPQLRPGQLHPLQVPSIYIPILVHLVAQFSQFCVFFRPD